MSDIFNEIDEEVRRERMQKLWNRYSLHIVIVAVLFVAGIAAWRGYEYLENQKATAAGAKFEAAVTLSEAGKHAEAEAAFAQVAKEAPAGYAILARFRAATELSQVKPEEGVKAFDALAADASLGATWQDLAALRAGLLLVDTAPLADLRQRLEPLTAPGRIYRHTARELLAQSAWRAQDFAAVRSYIDMVANDGETPPGTRSRMDLLSALIAGDGKTEAKTDGKS